MHLHHIIPKHMNGSDDPSNLIELTIAEHAKAHKILFEKYGCWEDEVAWKGLSKQIGKEEIIKKVLSEAGKKGGIKGRKTKKPWISESNKLRIGKKRPDLVLRNKTNNPMKRPEVVAKFIGRCWKQKIITCPHCGKSGGISLMKRYHFNNCKKKIP